MSFDFCVFKVLQCIVNRFDLSEKMPKREKTRLQSR